MVAVFHTTADLSAEQEMASEALCEKWMSLICNTKHTTTIGVTTTTTTTIITRKERECESRRRGVWGGVAHYWEKRGKQKC